MGFAWNNFGVLDDWDEDPRYLYIFNQNRDWRKISKSKYAPAIPNLKAKIETLKGKPILFRTSQNTSSWSTTEWFSDINIDKNGFQKPQEVVPFSNLEFSEGDEPEPTSNEELLNTISELEANNAELEAQKKRDSEKIEDLKAKSNADAKQLADFQLEIAKLNAQLREEAEALPQSTRRKIDADALKLEEMNLLGNEYNILVRGHPARELALRVGKDLPMGQKNIQILFLRHLNGNNYQVQLRQFDNVETIASIGFNDSRRMYVASFRNMDPDYFSRFEDTMGEPEANFKDREMTNDKRIEIFRRVMG